MYLLDTNIISELIRKSPNQGVVDWFERLRRISVCAIVLEEISYGIERAPEQKKGRLETWFAAFLEIPPDILPVDQEIAVLAGRLRGAAENRGRNLTQADGVIAATAIKHGMILVTRNSRDFEGLGVGLYNPFDRII